MDDFSPLTIAICFEYIMIYHIHVYPMRKKSKNPRFVLHQLEDRTPAGASPPVPSSRTRMLVALAGMATSVNVWDSDDQHFKQQKVWVNCKIRRRNCSKCKVSQTVCNFGSLVFHHQNHQMHQAARVAEATGNFTMSSKGVALSSAK